MKPITTILILLLLVSCQNQKQEIVWGFVGPLSGNAAIFGQTEQQAIDLAVSEINQKGGISGRPLRIIYEDGKCEGKSALSAAQKLIEQDNVRIILGGICSGETLAISPLAEEKKVILFSAVSSNPSISQAGEFVFRNAVRDNQGAKVLAKELQKRARAVAVLTEKTDFNIALFNEFKREFSSETKKVIAEEFETGNADVKTQLTKIKKAEPDVIILNTQTGVTGGSALRQARELGINVTFVGLFYVTNPDFVQAAGEITEKLLYLDAPALDRNNVKAVKLLEDFKRTYQSAPVSEFEVAARYDSVHLLAQAINSVGEDTEKIKDYLLSAKVEGTLGQYHFDENGDAIGIEYIVLKYKPI